MGNQLWPQFQNGIRERSIILKLDYMTQLSNDQPVVIPVRKQKVRWSKFSQEAINTNYVDPLLFDLSTLVWPETSDLNESVEFISDLLLKNSLPLAAPPPPPPPFFSP